MASSSRVSFFRLSLMMLLLAFAGTAFLYAFDLQGRLEEQEGYLWKTRRENFLLRSSLADTESEKGYLARKSSALTEDLGRAQSAYSKLRAEMLDVELALTSTSRERDRLLDENCILSEDFDRMVAENRQMAEQVFAVYVANHKEGVVGGMREAGSWLASVVDPVSGSPRAVATMTSARATIAPPGEAIVGDDSTIAAITMLPDGGFDLPFLPQFLSRHQVPDVPAHVVAVLAGRSPLVRPSWPTQVSLGSIVTEVPTQTLASLSVSRRAVEMPRWGRAAAVGAMMPSVPAPAMVADTPRGSFVIAAIRTARNWMESDARSWVSLVQRVRAGMTQVSNLLAPRFNR